MATNDNSTRGMFGDLDPKRDPREQILEPHLAAALQPALSTTAEVLGVLSLLPQAFSQAQRNELSRLERNDREPKQSPRIDAIRASIARADTLRATAAHGEARFARLVATMDDTAQIMHGFVSSPDLQPLANYRVEVSASTPNDPKGTQALSATTAEDGYFRIVLRERVIDGTTRDRATAAISRIIAGKIDAKNAAFKAAAAAEAAQNGRLGRILVKTPKGEVLYEDPIAVELDTGDVYREYVVGSVGKDTVPPPPQTVPPPTAPVPGTPGNPRTSAETKAAADAKARAEREAKTSQPAAPAPAKPNPSVSTKPVVAATPAREAQAVKPVAAPVKVAASKPAAPQPAAAKVNAKANTTKKSAAPPSRKRRK